MGWLQGKEERNEMMWTLISVLEESIVRCLCGNTLTPKMLKATRIEDEYWIYCHCTKCKNDFNYEKILNQYRAIKGVSLN